MTRGVNLSCMSTSSKNMRQRRMSSYFQMKWTCSSSLPLPPGHDIWWPRAELSHLQTTCTDNMYRGEWAHIFRWSGHAAQVYPPGHDIWLPRAELGHLQMTCTNDVYRGEWAHIFRWSVHAAQVYPNRQHVHRRMSSFFQMKCSCSSSLPCHPLVMTSGGQEQN